MGGSFGNGGYRFDGDAPQDFEDDFAGTDYGGNYDDFDGFDDRSAGGSGNAGGYYGGGMNDGFDDDFDGYDNAYNGSYSDGMSDDFDDGFSPGGSSRGRGGYDDGMSDDFDDGFSPRRGGYDDGFDDGYGNHSNVNYNDFEDRGYYGDDSRRSRSPSSTRTTITAGTGVPPTARPSRFHRYTRNISAQATAKTPITRSITARRQKRTTPSASAGTAPRSA